MKAITIWQPWASLIAIGAKKYETRSWATKYRGPIAIHAATRPAHKTFSEVIDYDTSKAMFKHFTKHNYWVPADLPHGSVIAIAELVDCHLIRSYIDETAEVCFLKIVAEINDEPRSGWVIPQEDELLFGDWTPGRYAWELANVKMLNMPIPAKGKQRLWDWEIQVA